MALNARLRGVMDWLLEGYPAGVPPKDYIPLVALLRRRLSDEEMISQMATFLLQGEQVIQVYPSLCVRVN